MKTFDRAFEELQGLIAYATTWEEYFHAQGNKGKRNEWHGFKNKLTRLKHSLAKLARSHPL